jgi:hypothetical protein
MLQERRTKLSPTLKQLRISDSNIDMDDSKSIICVANPDAGDSKPGNIDSKFLSVTFSNGVRPPMPFRSVHGQSQGLHSVPDALRDCASTLFRVAGNLNHVAGTSNQVVADAEAVAHF